ncbi:MAG TPA: GAF domain-containing protein [Blastocatellia bacterium]|nr:GAF domain-containing protein [Blastocatellia bacterium]
MNANSRKADDRNEGSWEQYLLDAARKVRDATSSLLNLEGVLTRVCEKLTSSQDFDFVALQLLRPAERVIETVVGSGRAEQWGGLGWKHYLDDDPSARDIQADIVLAVPPRAEVIAGWDNRFDRWIYKEFHHQGFERVFVPIIVTKDDSGRLVEDWFNHCELTVVRGVDRAGGCSASLELIPPPGDHAVEVIGTVEAGYVNETVAAGGLISQEHYVERVDQLIERAKALFKATAEHALEIWRARMPSALQVVTDCAMGILGGDSASLHFHYDPPQRRYVYELSCGRIGRRFLNDNRPRENGLGQQAIKAGKPMCVPNPTQDTDFRGSSDLNPSLLEKGISALAAIPMFVRDHKGVVYVHFHRPHEFSQDEIKRLQIFVDWCADALAHYVTYRQMRERARQLASLHSIVQSIVSNPEKKDLLRHIAWNTLNTLAADVVTIHECSGGKFLAPAVAARLITDEAMLSEVRPQDAPALVASQGRPIYAEESVTHPLLNEDLGSNATDGRQPFVVRERIKSSAAIPLRAGDETLGVMFVNYRRCHEFPDEEKNTIAVLASAACIAIKNKRLLEAIPEDLEAVVREIIATLDLPQVLSRVVKRAVEITGADLGVVSRLDPATQELVIHAKYPRHETVEPSWTRIKMGEGITGWVAVNKRPALVDKLSVDLRHRPFFSVEGSALCVPLLDSGGRTLGVLGVKSNKVSAFGGFRQRMLEVLANYAVIAIQNAESQTKLIAGETIATVGGLATQLVHWMNADVGLIRGKAKQIQDAPGGDDETKKLASEILALADQVASETSRLGSWIVEPSENVDLYTVVGEALRLVAPPSDITADIDLSKVPTWVTASRQQLVYVFVNLIQNASDAMRSGGRLTIEGGCSELDGISWVTLRVSDTGIGIPSEIIDHIFELGSSTKRGAEGRLGLGLWWAKTYVERLGGQLTVTSKPGVETCFTLSLPVAGSIYSKGE